VAKKIYKCFDKKIASIARKKICLYFERHLKHNCKFINIVIETKLRRIFERHYKCYVETIIASILKTFETQLQV
jgi:N-glycosylase/DNA lyase